MAQNTVIILPDGNWNYLPTLVAAARVTNSQPPLSETTAALIRYVADKDNTARIFRIPDPLSTGEGQSLLAEEVWEDTPSGHEYAVSLRKWYIKGTTGEKLEVQMLN